MGVLDWLFSSNEPKMIPAEPLTQFPTAEDAAFARKNGAFYGTAMDPFASGQSAMYFSNGVEPRTGVGQTFGDLVTPEYAQRFSASRKTPNADSIPDTYARSALAANRSAIASLGLDPRKFSMDGFTEASKANVGGAYSPETDHGFVIPGHSADASSTLVHEAIHRGLQKLRESGTAPAFKERTEYRDEQREPNTDEEMLVRLVMESMMGDPEQSPAALELKNQANDQFLGRDSVFGRYVPDYIQRLEAAAAQMIAKQKPGGPR